MAQITAGVKLYWRNKATSGGTAGNWTQIQGITSFPEIGGAPETLETTTTDNLAFKTYTEGLKDTGGALAFTANDTPEFRTAVKALLTAQESNTIEFGIDVPEPVGEYLKFEGKASSLGFGGAEVNSVLTTTLYITPSTEPEWVEENISI